MSEESEQTTNPAESLLTEANRLLEQRDLAAAMRAFDRAEAAGADADECAGGRWLVSMLRGNYEWAWRESDAIRRRGAWDPHRYWNGEPLRDKRVIVRCLHGYGDMVQGMRYAAASRELAAEMIWEVPPRMAELARYFAGVDRVMDWNAPPARAEWDVQVEVTELPYIFRTQVTDLPIAKHYLTLPESVLAEFEVVSSELPRIGLVWAAGDWDQTRSVPLDLLRPLVDREDCRFWNLQGGAAREGGQACLAGVGGCGEGCVALAATIAQMDLVITVDTFAAHLAGALGVSAWVMLQHAADWRWLARSESSPWYPSLRLFRQPAPGDWPAVTEQVGQALHQWRRVYDGAQTAEKSTVSAA
ncbi:MAG: hypothetical protein QOH85_1445 [Acidobacteriaceae bacterium]|jgi:hypothetical protein|nr:hypothetical protein [Acidobacteriaceae bacterium]